MADILLIDDSLTVTLSLQSALNLSGFVVEVAHSGQEGIDLISRGLKPSIIITDINMPGMDGLEVIGQVRQRLRFTPVLVLSADTSNESRQRARELGASGWLAKPISTNDLVRVIRQLVPNLANA